MIIRRALFAAVVALCALSASPDAMAQCGTTLPGGTLCGNRTGAQGLNGPLTNPILGIPGTSTGQLGLAGSGSGTATVAAQAAAGSPTLLLPTTSGTLPSTAASPLVLNATTGQLSCPACFTGSGGALTATSPLFLTSGVLSLQGGNGTIAQGSGGTGSTFTATPTLGVAGTTQGTLRFSGLSSGVVTVAPQSAAGTITLTLPNTAGTLADGASSPLVLNATTGNLTCPTCVTSSGGGAITGTPPISVSAAGVVSLATPVALNFGGTNASLTASNGGIVWSNATQFQILAGTATARLPLLSGASTTPQWGAYTLPASVTSGGIPFFSSTGAEGSSALLAANQIVLGGGAGTAPATLGSLGTATTVLHGNASGAPTFSAVAISADVSGLGTGVATALGNAVNAAGGLLGVSSLGTGVQTALGVNTGSTGSFGVTIAQGTLALATGAISSGTCTSAQTATATGVVSTDEIDFSFNSDPTATTGYMPGAQLSIVTYPTTNTANVKVCNNTANSITPGAVTLNWKVRR